MLLAVQAQTVFNIEVLLLDLRQMDPSFRMTLEELISLLFRNLVEKIRQGEQHSLIRDILKHAK